MLYLIKASIRPADQKDATYVEIKFPSRDNEVKNHNMNLQAQGYEVLDIKVEPWYSEEADPLYEQDETPNFEEVIDAENSNTDTTTGSSD